MKMKRMVENVWYVAKRIVLTFLFALFVVETWATTNYKDLEWPDVHGASADGVSYLFSIQKQEAMCIGARIPGGPGVKELTIPSMVSLTVDGKNYNCRVVAVSGLWDFNELEELSIDAPLDSLEELACHGLKYLKYIKLPQIKVIAYGTFTGCKSLNIAIPESVREIKSDAFSGCISMEKVDLSNVLSIGKSAFANCSSLSEIGIINSSIIGESSFKNCTSLTNVQINGSVAIQKSAFNGCSNLLTLTIGPNVNIIEQSAFIHNPLLKEINCLALNPPATTNKYSTFFDSNTYKTAKLTVPESSVELYKKADDWKNFYSIQGIITEDIQSSHFFPIKIVMDNCQLKVNLENYCGRAVIEFLDMQGRCRQSLSTIVHNNSINIDLSSLDLKPQVYVVKVSYGNNVINKKVIVN